MTTTVLITGASGLVGGELARHYLASGAQVVLLQHRSALPRDLRRATIVEGDITRPRLGLSSPRLRALRAEVGSILHCAALTDFSIPVEAGERVNVQGTGHLLDLAASCTHLERVGVLSTVYVAGKRTGRIREEELSHRAGFVNAYERSKYRMEQLVRREKRLPVAVYRLSTILGAEDGGVLRQNAVHRALRLFYNGLVPMVPGTPGSRVDLISTDYAVAAIARLFDHAFVPGRTYHIAAGRGGSMALAQFLERAAGEFRRHDARWAQQGVELPPIVSLATFRMLERSVETTGNHFLQAVLGALKDFAPQLSYPKVFDTTNAVRSLRPSGIRAVPMSQTCGTVIRHCLESGWRET